MKEAELTPMDLVRLARKGCKKGKQVYQITGGEGSSRIKVKKIVISFKYRRVSVEKATWWSRYTFEEINSGLCSFEIES